MELTFSSQMHQLILYLVVAEDNKAAFLATQGMLKVKWALQPLQQAGRSGGAMPYRMSMALRNSWAESSVPLTIEREDRQPSSVYSPHGFARLVN
jgi:hypothetical protein